MKQHDLILTVSYWQQKVVSRRWQATATPRGDAGALEWTDQPQAQLRKAFHGQPIRNLVGCQ